MRLRAGLLGLAVALAAAGASAKTYDFATGDNFRLGVSDRTGLRLRFDEPKLELRLHGRLHLDAAAFYDDVAPIENGALVRRGRLAFSTRILDDWSTKIEYEFAPDREGWRNLWLRWKPSRHFWIKAGNIVSPLGLEDQTASNKLTFLERSVSAALAPAYQTGAAIGVNGHFAEDRHHNWTAAVFAGVAPFAAGDDDKHRSEHVSVAGRITYAPIAEKRRVLHLGLAAEYRNIEQESRYRVRTRLESALAPALLNTGRLRDVDEAITFGVELGSVYGPLSFQGEYMQTFLRRRAGRPDPTFMGGYAQLSWVVTGESRRYGRTRGLFGSVRPERWWGAIELATRGSYVDLIDETVRGGQSIQYTLAANWWIRENVRLMGNYIAVWAKQRSTLVDDRPQIFQLRFMVYF